MAILSCKTIAKRVNYSQQCFLRKYMKILLVMTNHANLHNLSKPSRGWETFAVWYLQGTKKAMLESKGGAPAGTRQAKEITTETSRPRIQRYAWQLILAPDVNDSRHVALLSNQKGELTWLHSWAFGCQVKCIMVVQPRSSIGLCPGCHSRDPKLLS